MAQTAVVDPKRKSATAAQQGGRMLVLLRVATRSSTGESIEPFAHSLVDDNIGFAVGSFETGGKVKRIEDMRFLSQESRAEGWFYFVLPRGAHYLALLPPRRINLFTYLEMFNDAKKWRLNVPATEAMVYAGSLHIESDIELLFFGGKYIKNLLRMEVRDETKIAKDLVRQFVPGVSEVETSLMAAHEGPIILMTPTN